MDQVHLAQIELRGVGSYAAAVLDRGAGMGVALHPQPRKQGDLLGDSLAEAVLTIATDRHHHRLIDDHDVSLPHPTGPSVSGSATLAMCRLVTGPQSGYAIGHLLALAQRWSGTMTS